MHLMPPTSIPKGSQTVYEELQAYNFLTRWLHSGRYRRILKVVERFAAARVSSEPIRILDIGCGPGKLYALLDRRFSIDYHGCEIHPASLEAAQERYADRANFAISGRSVVSGDVSLERYDIIVALETLEHINERDVVRLIESIEKAKPKLFICSVPVEIGPAVWLKNVGSWICRYPRHEEYSWAQTFWAGFYQLDRLPVHQTGHIGFDWRWLAQAVRQNMKIKILTKLPISWLPAAVSSSIFIVAEP
jgi:2-polyprenyl-3-methyl-5-hydroxy-6-metoxy-1,4-benzoquinol methylase